MTLLTEDVNAPVVTAKCREAPRPMLFRHKTAVSDTQALDSQDERPILACEVLEACRENAQKTETTTDPVDAAFAGTGEAPTYCASKDATFVKVPARDPAVKMTEQLLR